MKENYLDVEVIKCIQIGLLCAHENPNARPIMTIVVSSLNNLSLELQSPQELAFSLQGRLLMDPKIAHESSSSQSTKSSTLFFVNEMSISNFHQSSIVS